MEDGKEVSFEYCGIDYMGFVYILFAWCFSIVYSREPG